MSERNGGAASAAPLGTVRTDSATPALADQWEIEAVEAIEDVRTPEEAEALLGKVSLAAEAMRLQRLGADRERRWKALRLKAERRYGELLPPPQQGKRTDKGPSPARGRLDKAASRAKEKARKVADVPREEFDAYMESDPEPTREGLLRASGSKDQRQTKRRDEPTIVGHKGEAQNPAVVNWVRTHTRRAMSSKEIVDASKAGDYDWPGGEKGLSDGTLAACRAAIAAEDRVHAEYRTPKKAPREGGTRLRQLHVDRRAGDRDGQSDLWKMQVAIAEAIGVLERIELPDIEWNEDVGHLLNEVVYDLERHRAWSDRQFDAAWAHMDDIARQRRLGELRKRAADPSSSQSERESAANLLEKHERKYREQRALQ